MLDIDSVKKELEDAERLIGITKKTREDAMMALTEAETKLNMSQKELEELGITPSNVDAEVKKLEDSITTLLGEIKSGIPEDLLRELKRI